MDKTTTLKDGYATNARPDAQTIQNILNFSRSYETQKISNNFQFEMIKNWTKSLFGGFFNETYLMKAIWNNHVIAESDETIVVERNHYFPAESVKKEFIKESATHTTCPWKGEASYYTLTVDGQENKDAAWYYPQTKPLANNIRNYIAFWKGVEISE